MQNEGMQNKEEVCYIDGVMPIFIFSFKTFELPRIVWSIFPEIVYLRAEHINPCLKDYGVKCLKRDFCKLYTDSIQRILT